MAGEPHDDFARRVLEASLAAGIEAPFASISSETPTTPRLSPKKMPTVVFQPSLPAAKGDLQALASEFDVIFGKFAGAATANQ